MTKLIINADDFGYSRAITTGILDAYKYGLLTSTTMMANMPGYTHALMISKDEPGLAIGVHLVLTAGRPLAREKSTLTGDDAKFLKREQLYAHPERIDLDELYEEWDAQINRIISDGITIDHLDSHHYVHGIPQFQPVAKSLANKYDLPIRNNFGEITPNVYTTEKLWKIFNFPQFKKMDASFDKVREQLVAHIQSEAQRMSRYQSVEANCHPGYIDEQIYFGSSFNLPRMREIEMLCDPLFRELLETEGFELTNYQEMFGEAAHEA